MLRIATGIAALDELIDGGFPEGSSIIISGRPGTGKTVLAHQMMFHNASPEFKVLYLTTLAEPQVKVVRYQQEFSYFDLAKFQNCVIYYDLGNILRKKGPAQALTVIDQLLREHQPRLVVVDTIKTVTDMIPSFTESREFLLDLSLRLTVWGCTSLFLGEYSEAEIDIRPESTIADGLICLYGTEERTQQKRYLRILKMRGTDHGSGQNVFKITADGISLFPRLNPEVGNQSYVQYEERLATGVKGLDELMGGGIPRSTVTLLSGASGTGKSLLAQQFILEGLQQGQKALYVTFEDNPDQIVASAMNIGNNLKPYVDNAQLMILHISPMELDIDEHVFQMQEAVRQSGASRLVIDSISAFELGVKDKAKYVDHIWALADFFKQKGVTALLTHEIHDSSDVSTITKYGISFVADNLLLLRYVEQGWDLKRYLRVVKMRATKHDTKVRELLIGEDGLAVGEVPRFPEQ